MCRLRVFAAIYASVLLASCSEPATTMSPGPEGEAPADDSFETAPLALRRVLTREVEVPAGYSVVDMNNRGDLLLGAAWLPSLKRLPLALPFTGRSIDNHRQILGPGRLIYKSGRVTELPDPCIPIVGALNPGTPEAEPLVFDCVDRPVEVSALADNGDAIAEWRQDARGTMSSPFRFFKIWRAHSRTWESGVDFGSSESGHVDAAISDTGLVAMRVSTFPWHSVSFLVGSHGLLFDGICPMQQPTPFSEPQAIPRAVNDAGETVGFIDCRPVDVEVRGVRWSRIGAPTSLDGAPSLIDNFGNAAGVRASDGHAVIWLADGSAIDLSAAVGNQPVNLRKFLKRGQIFGFVGTQPVIWRFGF